jgi:hypothetical protein
MLLPKSCLVVLVSACHVATATVGCAKAARSDFDVFKYIDPLIGTTAGGK